MTADETVEAIARAYCKNKGIDPDDESFGWKAFVPNVRDHWAMFLAIKEATGLTVLTAEVGVEEAQPLPPPPEPVIEPPIDAEEVEPVNTAPPAANETPEPVVEEFEQPAPEPEPETEPEPAAPVQLTQKVTNVKAGKEGEKWIATWDAVPGSTGYEISYKAASVAGGEWQTIKNIPANRYEVFSSRMPSDSVTMGVIAVNELGRSKVGADEQWSDNVVI